MSFFERLFGRPGTPTADSAQAFLNGQNGSSAWVADRAKEVEAAVVMAALLAPRYRPRTAFSIEKGRRTGLLIVDFQGFFNNLMPGGEGARLLSTSNRADRNRIQGSFGVPTANILELGTVTNPHLRIQLDACLSPGERLIGSHVKTNYFFGFNRPPAKIVEMPTDLSWRIEPVLRTVDTGWDDGMTYYQDDFNPQDLSLAERVLPAMVSELRQFALTNSGSHNLDKWE